MEIVGVVADVKYVDVRVQTRRHFYMRSHSSRASSISLFVRTTGSEQDASAFVRQAVERLDPHMPIYTDGPCRLTRPE